MLSIRINFLFVILLSTLMIIDVRCKEKSNHQQDNHVHTWHTIVSLNGTWYDTLHVMTENEHGISFVDGSQNHSVVQNPFVVSESLPFDYGLVINDEVGFNMLYSLTLNQQVIPDPSQSNSRICVYLIAAHPQIIPVSFHGNTTCLWQSVEGRGENFWVM